MSFRFRLTFPRRCLPLRFPNAKHVQGVATPSHNGVGLLLLFCHVNTFVVVRGIWLYCFNFKQIAAGLLLNLLCHFAGVSAPREVGNEGFSLTLRLPRAAQGNGGSLRKNSDEDFVKKINRATFCPAFSLLLQKTLNS
jgi:hypothetical protein